MLEEQKREERSGYQFGGSAHIGGSNDNNKSKVGGSGYSRDNSKKEDDIIDTYGDDFEDDIEEDLPEDNNLLESNDNVNPHKNITESAGGITVS